ncbi:hypothetical protein NDU88_000593 [Pleurodeles waltl]|uniref:Uncharacterized protein n=1 Tax=Pleurodeles waltl TaxID=8319 RepID=A0AAV7SX50_PLEWA|nr:hypothetical protein NDU88_000593 [Pleurodeles waltl]
MCAACARWGSTAVGADLQICRSLGDTLCVDLSLLENKEENPTYRACIFVPLKPQHNLATSGRGLRSSECLPIGRSSTYFLSEEPGEDVLYLMWSLVRQQTSRLHETPKGMCGVCPRWGSTAVGADLRPAGLWGTRYVST